MAAITDFNKRVVRAQPLTVTRATLTDLVRSLAPVRTYEVSGFPSSYWLFQDHYWSVDPFPRAQAALASGRLGAIRSQPEAAEVMTAYRRVIFAPGPLMGALLLVACAATAGLGRARWSGDRVAVGLLAGACMVPLLTTAAISGFSWRYQLPQLPLLPTAGALGLTALVRGPRPGAPVPREPLRPLDTAAALLARLPLPASWRRAMTAAVERGWVQVVLALLAGVVAGVLVMLLAVRSGWFDQGPAAAGGLLAGLALSGTLLVSWWRADALPRRS
jgi:hypothetical protein